MYIDFKSIKSIVKYSSYTLLKGSVNFSNEMLFNIILLRRYTRTVIEIQYLPQVVYLTFPFPS